MGCQSPNMVMPSRPAGDRQLKACTARVEGDGMGRPLERAVSCHASIATSTRRQLRANENWEL